MTIVLSSIETKYMAMTEAVVIAIWIKGLVGGLSLQQDDIVVFCDS